MCSTGHDRNGILFIGMGLVYRKTKETDFSWTSYGRNGGPVHREGCGVTQNGTPRDTVHLHRRPPPASTSYCHPLSTSSSLHLRLFIHGLLFIQPPPCATPPATVQPPLHGLLFIQPSTVYCSSSPPQGGPVHPALPGLLFIHPQPARSIGVVFIQRQRPLLPRGPVHPTPHRELFIQTPSTTLTVHQEAAGSMGFS